MTIHIPRAPWGPDFRDVIIHAVLSARDAHPAYRAAKTGDGIAAKKLVEDLLNPEGSAQLARLVDDRPVILLGVTADEAGGFNAIPDAMAQALAERLRLRVAPGSIVQANKVGHTRADGWHRLVTPAVFNGDVVRGGHYVLLDDHVGFGGTLANLRGFIEEGGAKVIGMTALTETREARKIAIRPTTLDLLQAKHGEELEHFWRTEFGHGLGCLTNIEGGYLCRVESVAAIKTRMAQAAELAGGRGLSSINLSRRPSLDE
jgi:hypothetical protein